MSDEKDIELVKMDEGHALRIAGIGRYPLDDRRLYELALVGLEAVRLCEAHGPQVPPYVVVVVFEDDEDDDGTDWKARTSNRELAGLIKEAAQIELKRTGCQSGIVARMPAFPERDFYVAGIDEHTTVPSAMASFRAALLTGEDGVINGSFDETYFRDSGFTYEEAGALRSCVANSLFECVSFDSNLTEILDSWIEDTDDDDLDGIIDDEDIDKDALMAKLRRWCLGEDLTRAVTK